MVPPPRVMRVQRPRLPVSRGRATRSSTCSQITMMPTPPMTMGQNNPVGTTPPETNNHSNPTTRSPPATITPLSGRAGATAVAGRIPRRLAASRPAASSFASPLGSSTHSAP